MVSLVLPDTDSSSRTGDRPSSPAAVDPGSLPTRSPHTTVLLTRPVAIEPTGLSTGSDAPRAQALFQEQAVKQWNGLRDAYESIDAVDLRVLDPEAIWNTLQNTDAGQEIAPPETLHDAVFCANVAVPYPEQRRVVLARMAAQSRADEPAYAAAWFEDNGYGVDRLPTGVGPFEGTGDAIWHPGRRLLWGGVGERTDRAAYDHLAEVLDVPVLTLDPTDRIDDDVFFHLDICFSPLDEETVLLVREVFDDEELSVIEGCFEQVIDVPYEEGRPGGDYAANAHCPDGEHVLLQASATETIERLDAAGFTPVPVETSAFIEGCAGSVFCLKLALP